ncbi:hypothetical protein LBMAG55_07150 [Verrucomicrobiota bacterium]|nr:hypothetical protein LBMAG55_07150 [Verrucomicrobiota bacterium]
MANEDGGLTFGAVAEDGDGPEVAAVIEARLLKEGFDFGRHGAGRVLQRLRHQRSTQGSRPDRIVVDMGEPSGPGG